MDSPAGPRQELPGRGKSLRPPPLRGFLAKLSEWYATRPELTGVTVLREPIADEAQLLDRLIRARQPVVLKRYLDNTSLHGIDFADLNRRAGHFVMDPRQKPSTIVQNYGAWVDQAPPMTLADYIETAVLTEPPKAADMYSHYRNLRLDDDFADALGLVKPRFVSESEIRPPCIWLGRRGSQTGTHIDPQDNIVFTVIGHKRFHVFSPADIPNLYLFPVGNTLLLRSPVDPREVDAERHALSAGRHCVQIDLKAGDCLFLPLGWPHFVETVTEAFSYNYWLKPESRPFFTRLR